MHRSNQMHVDRLLLEHLAPNQPAEDEDIRALLDGCGSSSSASVIPTGPPPTMPTGSENCCGMSVINFEENHALRSFPYSGPAIGWPEHRLPRESS
jgi:hypothetical protein